MDPAPMRLSRTADRMLWDEPLMQGATSKVRPERAMSLWKRASRFSLQLITTLRTFSTAAAVIAVGRPEAVVVLSGFKEGVEAEAPELPEAPGFLWAFGTAVASGTCICNMKDCGTSMYPRSSGSWLAGSRSRTLQSRQNKSNKTAVMTGVLRPPLIQHRATTASASACGSLRVALAASSRGVAMGLPSWPTGPTSSNCSAASASASSASAASSALAAPSGMPPPSFLPAKRKAPPKEGGGGASPPKKLRPPADNEVLDDNVFERRCKARELAASSADGSSSSGGGSASFSSGSASSSSAAPAAPAPALGPASLDKLDDEAEGDFLGCRPVGPQLPPVLADVGKRGVATDDDDDEDFLGLSAGPLAQGDEVIALPEAPKEKAKPQACDLELDMFGNPVED
mmetsp:Transcript_113456/g.367011  ORF Transcript_113456/g.367011 Transcript_113456/m.367011 type:complete len:400 (+) Transcript_113456:622-1821(+)